MQPYPTIQNYANYQPYPQPFQDRLMQMQNQYQQANVTANNQGILWVQGEAGAKSYLVAPNSTVLLMDSETTKFYLKSSDGSGMPSMRIFEYKEIVNNAQNALQGQFKVEKELDSKYVTREEYEGLKRQYDEIIEKLKNNLEEEQSAKQKTKSKGANINE